MNTTMRRTIVSELAGNSALAKQVVQLTGAKSSEAEARGRGDDAT